MVCIINTDQSEPVSLSRMTSWTQGANTETNTYAGAEWHRVSTTSAGVTTGYLYDGDNVVADLDGTGAVSKLYVTPFLDQNVSVTDVAAGTTHYYTADGLGSVRTLTDAGGLVVNSYDYTAFGEAYQPNTVAGVDQRYTYTGREKSGVGGPMYYRYRFADPMLGRWGARDPIGYLAGPNLYGYVSARPQAYSDAYGLFDKATITYPGRGGSGFVRVRTSAAKTECYKLFVEDDLKWSKDTNQDFDGLFDYNWLYAGNPVVVKLEVKDSKGNTETHRVTYDRQRENWTGDERNFNVNGMIVGNTGLSMFWLQLRAKLHKFRGRKTGGGKLHPPVDSKFAVGRYASDVHLTTKITSTADDVSSWGYIRSTPFGAGGANTSTSTQRRRQAQISQGGNPAPSPWDVDNTFSMGGAGNWFIYGDHAPRPDKIVAEMYALRESAHEDYGDLVKNRGQSAGNTMTLELPGMMLNR